MSLTRLSVKSFGLHIGGGAKDAGARDDFLRALEAASWRYLDCYRSLEQPGSVGTFGADLTKFVREGNLRGLFEGRAVVSMLTGEPEYLDPLKDETPKGWIVTGYPWSWIKTPEHDAFLKAYQAKYNDYPRLGSRSSATRPSRPPPRSSPRPTRPIRKS